MATQNPVLYALDNLRSGRSTGAFRGVQATPQLSDVGTKRAAETSTYLENLRSIESETAESRASYESLVPSLEEGVKAKQSAYETLGKTLTPQVDTLKTAYEAILKQVTPQIESAKSAYGSALAPLAEQATSAKTAYDASIAGLAAQKAGIDADRFVTEMRTRYSIIASNFAQNPNFYGDAKVNAGYRQELVNLEAALNKSYEPLQSSSAAAYANYQSQLETTKTMAAQAQEAYKNATSSLESQVKSAYDPYSAAATSAQSQLEAAYKDYTGTAASATSQASTAYEAAYGEQNRLTEAFKQKQQELDSLGYLAFAGPSADSASPALSTGASLAETDLYSDELESTMLGRKQLAQQTLGSPEDDLVTGALQSSMYSKS